MTDYHVHIGQYENVYYYADRVFGALKSAGVDEAWFSSTTSCIYCTESEAARANPEIAANAPDAQKLYEAVRDEIRDALCAAAEIGIKARALYWVVPDIHFSQKACVSVKRVMEEKAADGSALYAGFKIHPRAQKWNLSDAKTAALAEEIFSYAEANNKRILIHCGTDKLDSPCLFEPLISRHPAALVQLAHSRPLDQTLYMLGRYHNLVCDSAMASPETVEKIKAAGFAGRLLYGSDFPINHWRKEKPKTDPSIKELAQFAIV